MCVLLANFMRCHFLVGYIQVGWEISKVMETLKASGHEVSLVINAGNKESANPEQPANGTAPLGEISPRGKATAPLDGGEDTSQGLSSHDDSYDSPLSLANAKPLTNTSQSTTSDVLSSSQDTLDDMVDSPASFEGDTDFSGMEKLLVKNRSLDLHRTSSAPLIERERAGLLEASDESGLSSADSRVEGKRMLGNPETGSLEGVDGGEEGRSKASSSQPYEMRLQMRTASDGTVEKAKNPVSWYLYRLQGCTYTYPCVL